jgi:hypothetical protein
MKLASIFLMALCCHKMQVIYYYIENIFQN